MGTERGVDPEMMRVLLDVSAVPARPAGAGVYTWALARGLAAADDIELHLVTRRDDADRWTALAPSATVHAEVPPARPARLVWEQTGAVRLARRVAPEVWHGPHYTMPLRTDVPCVVTVHDLTFFDHPEWHERTKVPYFRRMIRAAAHRAAAIVCVSQYTADRLRALVPPRGAVFVARHGVDHDRFRPDADAAEDARLLAAHGIAPPYIGFVGTIEPRKNLPTLVAAFAPLARARPDLRLVLAGGDGWGATQVREAVAASGVATRILRTGYVEDDVVPALYRRAAAVAYPSFEEGFGVPALEALACGAPLVTTRGSALGEVVGDAACTVAPGDTAALTHALATLLDDDAVSARLRAAGPLRAAPFTWDASVAAHVDIYRAVAARKAA
jgi:glycosyltransferase involved in cell wall biosynthesis